jgi:hypothetical protein
MNAKCVISIVFTLLTACGTTELDNSTPVQAGRGAEQPLVDELQAPIPDPLFGQRQNLTYCGDTNNLARLEWMVKQSYQYAYNTPPDSCELKEFGDSYEYHCYGFLRDIDMRIPKTTIFYGRGNTKPLPNNMVRACGFFEALNISTGVREAHGTNYCNCTTCYNVVNDTGVHASTNVDICYHPKWDNAPITGPVPGARCPAYGCPQ